MKLKIIVIMFLILLTNRLAFANPSCTWACHLPLGEKCIGQKKKEKTDKYIPAKIDKNYLIIDSYQIVGTGSCRPANNVDPCPTLDCLRKIDELEKKVRGSYDNYKSGTATDLPPEQIIHNRVREAYYLKCCKELEDKVKMLENRVKQIEGYQTAPVVEYTTGGSFLAWGNLQVWDHVKVKDGKCGKILTLYIPAWPFWGTNIAAIIRFCGNDGSITDTIGYYGTGCLEKTDKHCSDKR